MQAHLSTVSDKLMAGLLLRRGQYTSKEQVYCRIIPTTDGAANGPGLIIDTSNYQR